MEWTSITTAISLGVIAICSIVIVGLLWRKHSPALVRIERVITWITFLIMLISLGLLTTYEVPDKSVKVEFSLIASVLAILVTVLVGWQVWQALISREQIRNIEARLRNLEQSTTQIIDDKILHYDIENQSLQYFIMGRSSMQLHGIVESINNNSHLNIKTDLLAQSFGNIGLGMQQLKKHPNSENYKHLYNALETTIKECERCEKSLEFIDIKDIDRILDAIQNDNEYREHNKQDLIHRLESIKSAVMTIKTAPTV